jgi:undecaprenyl-diphosphatase
MPKITLLGSATFSIALCVSLLLWGMGTVRVAAAESLAALAGSHVIVQMIKRFTGRQRPYLALSGVRTLASLWTDHSFPSGHTAAAFSLAAGFTHHFPLLEPALFGMAGLVGISRLYLGQHYPTDVLIGAILGTLAVELIHYLKYFSWLTG